MIRIHIIQSCLVCPHFRHASVELCQNLYIRLCRWYLCETHSHVIRSLAIMQYNVGAGITHFVELFRLYT